MPAYTISFELASPGAKPQELYAFARARSLSQEWGPVAKSGNKILVGTGDITPPYEPNADVQELILKAVTGLATKEEVQGLLKQAVTGLATKEEVQGLLKQAVTGLATKTEIRELATKTEIGELATKAEVQKLLKTNTDNTSTVNHAKWLVDGTGASATADEKIYSSYPPEAVLENHTAPYWYHNTKPELQLVAFFVELPEPVAFDRAEITFYKDNHAKTVSVYNDENGDWLGLVSEFDGGRVLTINGTGQVRRFRFEFSDKNSIYVAITSIQIF